MTTYYISPYGSDSNNGLGPDASHASNKPYLTLGKVLVSGSALSAGDTVYVGPGYLYGAGNHTVLGTISSVGSPTQIIGDPTNAQGFKDAGGILLSPGIPWITTRTSGEGLDSDIASSSALMNLSTNNVKGLQFKMLALEASMTQFANIFTMSASGTSDILFQDCFLSSKQIMSGGTSAPTATRNITFRRNTILCREVISWSNNTNAAATADADLTILIEENLIFGWIGAPTAIALTPSGGNLAGGIRIYDNTIIASQILQTTASRVSTVTPITCAGNLMICLSSGVAMNSGTSGQIIDGGYNRYFCGAANTNVTTAGTTLFNPALNIALPHLVKWGLEMPRADMFGWTDAAHANQKFSASGSTTPDFRGRTVRPWGAGASIGCWQAQDVVQDTSSAITGGGTNSLKLTGAGEVSQYIPVNAVAQTVSIRTKSTSYGGTNYPQMIVVANPSCGVMSDTTVTASDASEQTITTATITPTSKGVMEVRLISRSTSVSSTTHFDILQSP